MTRKWQVFVSVVLGCSGTGQIGGQDAGEAGLFVDYTAASGVDFTHVNGAFGMKWMPEVNGAGAAFFDADGDGWTDLLFTQGTHWEGHEPVDTATFATPTMKLYRNRGNGTFEDATPGSGLDIALYGFAAAPADYDNDGDQDVYVTAYGANRLFRNEGDGSFADVTGVLGAGDPSWSSSAAWLDFDHDGDLDLFVGNYLDWRPGTHQFCSIDGENRAYCNPRAYPGSPPTLYRNDGARFTDVSAAAGIPASGGKTLGVVAADVDGDSWVDLVVANDTEPDWLLHNLNGIFEEVGMIAGMAVDAAGLSRAGMGIDVADYRNDGRTSIAVGNFSNEMIGLYEPTDTGGFVDVATRGSLGPTSLASLTFGLLFLDYNLDGRLDLLTINGHIYEHPEVIEPGASHEQRPLLYYNHGDGRLTEVAVAIGGPLALPIAGRGAAYADFDRDGDLDIAVTSNAGPAYLWRNRQRDAGAPPHVLRVTLQGAAPRDAVGARVTVRADGWQQTQQVKSGASYLSQSEAALTFGLGNRESIDAIEVFWCDGERLLLDGAVLDGVVDTELVIIQGRGITGTRPL